jgi:hypothetical protein
MSSEKFHTTSNRKITEGLELSKLPSPNNIPRTYHFDIFDWNVKCTVITISHNGKVFFNVLKCGYI